jgi:hypothetical protein
MSQSCALIMGLGILVLSMPRGAANVSGDPEMILYFYLRLIVVLVLFILSAQDGSNVETIS